MLEKKSFVSFEWNISTRKNLGCALMIWSIVHKVLVKDIMQHPLSRKNPFHPVRTGYSLLFALELMAKEEELHRVPIVDGERNLVNLITQVGLN